MSSVLRAGAVLFGAISTLIVACSGGDDVTITSPPAGGTTSGTTSGSSGGTKPPTSSGSVGTTSGFPGTSSSGSTGVEPGQLDVYNLKTVTVGHDVCGKPNGKCFDAQSFTIDFDSLVLTHQTCVELGGPPDSGPSSGSTTYAVTKRDLTKDDVASVQKALLQVRVSDAPHTGFDGPIDSLEILDRAGNASAYSPSAGCSQDKFKTVVEGFDIVWDTVRALK